MIRPGMIRVEIAYSKLFKEAGIRFEAFKKEADMTMDKSMGRIMRDIKARAKANASGLILRQITGRLSRGIVYRSKKEGDTRFYSLFVKDNVRPQVGRSPAEYGGYHEGRPGDERPKTITRLQEGKKFFIPLNIYAREAIESGMDLKHYNLEWGKDFVLAAKVVLRPFISPAVEDVLGKGAFRRKKIADTLAEDLTKSWRKHFRGK